MAAGTDRFGRTTWTVTPRAGDAPAAREVSTPRGQSFRAVTVSPRKTVLSTIDTDDSWGLDVVVTTEEQNVESDDLFRDLMETGLTALKGFAHLFGGNGGDVNLTVTAEKTPGGDNTVAINGAHLAVVPANTRV
jgi:hypothetical protein